MSWDYASSAEYYDLIFSEKDFDSYAQFLSTLLGDVKTVLELACGTGLYLTPLKKLGYDIEGLDISKQMLESVRKKDHTITVYEQDMTEFDTGKKYDAILLLNSGLVLLKDYDEITRTIKKISEHLNKKGILVLDLPNHEVEIAETTGTTTDKLTEDIALESKDYQENDRWVTEWTIIDGEKKIHERFEELIYDKEKIEQILTNEGFVITQKFGSRDGQELTDKSYRWVLVCEKVEE